MIPIEYRQVNIVVSLSNLKLAQQITIGFEFDTFKIQTLIESFDEPMVSYL